MENRHNDIPSPLIDLSPICGPECNERDLLRIGKEIVKNFEDPGFVYLKNTGISTEEIKEFVEASEKFFELDYEIKLKYCRNYDTYHGFSTDDSEVLNHDTPMDTRTTKSIFDIQGLDEPFPDEVPEFKAATKPIADKLVPITKILFKSIAVGLGLPAGFLVDKHKHLFTSENYSDLRITSYSPPSTDDQTIRCEAHCDFSTITLHMYADLVGLQLLDSKGEWQPAKTFEGYSILFPSEQLQMMTDGKIKAAMHQVLNPTDEREIPKPRHAVIFFIHPDHDVNLRPGNSKDSTHLLSKDYTRGRAREYFKEEALLDLNNDGNLSEE